MTHRQPLMLYLLGFVTFGIYFIVWMVQSKGEMVRLGADIPTCWLIIVPIANIYFIWKWYQGVEHVTNGAKSGAMLFILNLIPFVGIIVPYLVQDGFNQVAATP